MSAELKPNDNAGYIRNFRVFSSGARDFTNWLVQMVNGFLEFFSLRKKRKFWGIVYDSVTKQPLDPALVKMVYVDEEDTQTCVTDLAGSYGFLAHPGKFKLLAKKTNYIFPSQLVAGDQDGIYEHLYHGEFFQLDEGSEVVAPNIPMDPVGKDWNQTAKLAVFEAHPYTRYLFKRLVAILFWFGFCLELVFLWKDRHAAWVVPACVLVLYVFLVFVAWIAPRGRLWGQVKQKVFWKGELLLELQNPATPGVVFGKTATLGDGKFLLRGRPGRYQLQVSHKTLEGEVTVVGHANVRIGKPGVLNSTIVVR